MNIVPVTSLLTPSGSLYSLSRVLGDANAMPVKLEAQDNPYTSFSVMGRSISTSLAAKLGIGTIFDGTLNANEQAWWFDAATYTDKYRIDPAGPGAVAMTRWGVGLRIVIRVYDIKAGTSLNYMVVGAAVQMGLAQAQYEITGMGIGMAGLKIVLDNMSLTGQLTAESYFKLTTVVGKQLKEYIDTHVTELTPQPIAAGIVYNLEEDKVAMAQSIFYAMRSIAGGRSLRDSLERALPTYDRDAIRYAYGVVAGNIPDMDEPSRDAERKAEKWLKTP
jgi:hypothetical protein